MKEERLAKLEEAAEEAREELPTIQSMIDNVENAAGGEEVGDIDIPAREALSTVQLTLGTVNSTVNAARTHDEAVERDARDQLAVGDEHPVVISDAGGSGSDAVGRIEGIITFVETNGFDINAADTVNVKLTGVDDSFCHAIALEKVDD